MFIIRMLVRLLEILASIRPCPVSREGTLSSCASKSLLHISPVLNFTNLIWFKAIYIRNTCVIAKPI